jgi:hypothetical protein
MKQKLTTEQKLQQKLAPELSFKIMQIGETILQLEEDYLNLFEDEELKAKIKKAADLIREIAEDMQDMHAQRLKEWRKYVRRSTGMGFLTTPKK